MSVLDRWDPLDSIRSWWGGSSEFDWWWDRASEVILGGDQYEPGTPVPVHVPDVISEIPQTWEEYEEQYPEYFEPILETRPGRTPDPYPQGDILGDPYDESFEEDDEVAHTWGHLARELVGGWLDLPTSGPAVYDPSDFTNVPAQPNVSNPAGATNGAAGCEGMVWSGAAPPKGYKVVNYCGQGVLRKIRRRRRRRMLTASDASDLATIVGIVGKGQMASSMINRTRS